MQKSKLFIIALSIGLLFPASAFANDVIAIIANSANPVTTVGASHAKKMYMNTLLTWSNGNPIVMYDLKPNDPLRQFFSKKVLGMSARKVAERWAHLRITNRAKNPPINIKSQRLLIRRIAVQKWAIGYISLDAVKKAQNPNIKIVGIIK